MWPSEVLSKKKNGPDGYLWGIWKLPKVPYQDLSLTICKININAPLFILIFCILVTGNSSYFLFLYRANICQFWGNLMIFHFQGLAIQNLAVVSCLLSVSVSKVLAIYQTGLFRWDVTPPPVPSVHFETQISTSRVWHSTNWATWRQNAPLMHHQLSNKMINVESFFLFSSSRYKTVVIIFFLKVIRKL